MVFVRDFTTQYTAPIVHTSTSGEKEGYGFERKIVKKNGQKVIHRRSVVRADVISQSSPCYSPRARSQNSYYNSDRGVGLGHDNVTGDERIGLWGSGGGMGPRRGVGGGPMVIVEMRRGDRGWLGRSTVAGG